MRKSMGNKNRFFSKLHHTTMRGGGLEETINKITGNSGYNSNTESIPTIVR
jgi:hypothetical protein